MIEVAESNGTGTDRGRRFAAMAEAVVAALAAAVIMATLVWQWRHNFAIPIYDDLFDRLRFYRALPSAGALIRYLISAHNEHRIMTTRLVALADEHFFAGREHTQIIATNLLQCLSAYVAYRFVFLADLGRNIDLSRRLLIGLSILLLFVNPNFLYTLIVPFQLQHAILAFLVIVAAALMSRSAGPEMPAAEQTRLVLALVAIAAVGTFTLGNAPAILIAAAATAIVLRCPVAVIRVLAVLAVAHTLIVVATTTSVGETSTDIVAMGKFALIYWGGPFLRFDPWPSAYVTWGLADARGIYLAATFGAVVFATTVGFGILRCLRPRTGGRLAVFGFMVLVVVVVTGLAAAHSRAQFGILEGASKKYASFAGLGWLGVLAVFTGVVRERFAFLSRPETPVFALLLAVVLPLSTLGYMRETRIWQKMIDRNWEASLAVFLHVNDQVRLHDIYTDESELVKYVGYIEPKGRAIFSYFPFRWDDDAKIVLARRRPAECRGVVERFDPLPAQDLTNDFQSPGTAVSMSGWTWMTEDHAPPETIIAVDSENHIAGVARITRTNATAEEWLGQKLDEDVGWFGYVRLIRSPPVSFIALSSDGEHFCALGPVGTAR
jgi:hypothetical protein